MADPSDSLPREERFAQTRQSLIEKLGDWEDQKTWDEFYQTYWRLIFAVSRKSGLSEDEAFDVVQETILCVAKQWKDGQKYDPQKGSFKNWLLNLTRWRIADQFRKKQKNPAAGSRSSGNGRPQDQSGAIIPTVELLEDEKAGNLLERMWDTEWRANVSRIALDSVRKQVSPKQYQIFDAYVIKGWDVSAVMEKLGVSRAQVYLAKHRIGSMVRTEINRLEKEIT